MIELDKIQLIANQLVERYKQQLYSAGIRQDSTLYDTDIIVELNGSTIAISLIIPEHWKNVEFGRRAGAKMPPIDVISKWISIKGIVPDARNTKIKDPKQLAFPIAKAIARDGIRPRNILEGTGLVYTYTNGQYGFAEANDVFIQLIKKEIVSKLINNFLACKSTI
jgi:hypothetical protein